MEPEDEPLDGLADAVLEGQPVDWASEESTPDAPGREVVRQLKVLAGIAELHRTLADETPVSERSDVPEEHLERWGRLRILERIGHGSFGDVYRAWDSKLDREVAVKLLHAGREQPEGATVLREARLLARVRHPNVAIVYDADEIEGRVGLWMEFIHGHNLEQALGDRGKLPDREVTWIGIELCRALTAVHAAGLVHRDIKAQNLMQAGDGRLVLMDFGTGRELEETPGSTVDAAGTPLYLAPEIFDGAKATVRSDIYSTGVLLFHLLTGAYPVRGATIKEVGESHAGGRRLDLAAEAPGVNKALAAVIGQAIETDPSKRFESARDMLTALESVQRGTEKPRRAALIAAGFALAVVLVGAAAWLSRGDFRPAEAPLSFKARDWVLVSSFENRSGEKLFDGTLDYALGLELANSRYVNVVPSERVRDALRLMRTPQNTPLDATLAREVCLRDGGIRALLTGRVERLGPSFLVTAELVDPRKGTILARFREESAGTEGSLAAVRLISDRVRAKLGETPAFGEPDGAELARVTTNSLRALQLYSRADLLMKESLDNTGLEDKQAAAEVLLRQAVAEDPSFASAWIHLAWTLRNQGRTRAEFEPLAETALQLSETTTERERYFIRGSYDFLLERGDKGRAAYETLIALYPDHYWAPFPLLGTYDFWHSADNLEKAIQAEARIADLRPTDFFFNWNALSSAVVVKPDTVRAERFLRRATAAITPDVSERWPDLVAWMDLLPFTQNWLKGEIENANAEIDRVAGRIDALGGRSRDGLAMQTALGYVTLGRLHAATQTARTIADPGLQNAVLAQIAFFKEDEAALRHRLESQRDPEPDSPEAWQNTMDPIHVLQARKGLRLEPETPSLPASSGDWSDSVLRGEIALAHRHRAEAVRELEAAWEHVQIVLVPPSYYLARESLAAILGRRGDIARAIQILERRPEDICLAWPGTTYAYELRNRLQLAQLYRRAGRVADAQAVEAELKALLAFADPDHPILIALRRLETS